MPTRAMPSSPTTAMLVHDGISRCGLLERGAVHGHGGVRRLGGPPLRQTRAGRPRPLRRAHCRSTRPGPARGRQPPPARRPAARHERSTPASSPSSDSGSSIRRRAAACFSSRRSSLHAKRTGTVNMVSSTSVMPPTLGMAMGIMMSAPRPVAVSTGSSARIVVALVIRQGRTRRSPACTVASRISSRSAARAPRCSAAGTSS
jgi:hypothetical protein